MPRTTEEDMRLVIETDANFNIAPFIEVANTLTDKIEACAIARGETLTEDQLRHIENYLAAYFYTGREPRMSRKQTERASASFMQPDFLEMAKLLDTSGCLDMLMREQHYADVTWLGKPPSTQIDYVDRD